MCILNIGPLDIGKKNVPVGGETVLFKNWITFCQEKCLDFIVIDSLKLNYGSNIKAYRLILKQFIYNINRVECVFFNGTSNDYLYLAPILVFICKMTGKRIFLRKFAGNFDSLYNKKNFLLKSIIKKTLSNATGLFWETKRLVYFGEKFNKNSFWFPNVRCRGKSATNHQYSRKFVFISQVRKEKGIDVLLKCFQNLQINYQLDIYGPLFGYEEKELSGKNYRYKRILSPSEVSSVLSKYDCLILPSYCEGYPGVIIEAYSVSIPVIATDVGGISEIVKDRYNGLLIHPGSSQELYEAIIQMDTMDYQQLTKNAKDSFSNFDSEIVNHKILTILKSN